MQRLPSQPRPDWQKTVESQGFHFHTPESQPYWDESAYYLFSRNEVDELEKATYALNDMCLQAVQFVIDYDRFEDFSIPPQFVDYVKESWDRDEFTVYGRFDLSYDGKSPPKLLEYNADTPTSLVEAAVVQWYWFKDLYPGYDQFNSIHERLIQAWTQLKTMSSAFGTSASPMYFACLADSMEDFMTTNYLRDTAVQAGLTTEIIELQSIGWNAARKLFVDLRERPIDTCFKLYPWEWLVREKFGPHLLQRTTRWLEAPWKMILSNKTILAILHEMFPDSPYILEAGYEHLSSGSYVRKPILSREGANIQVVQGNKFVFETPGPYEGPYVYQALHPLPDFTGRRPVIGSWMVNGYACGIGIREDATLITGNLSRFVPHVFSR